MVFSVVLGLPMTRRQGIRSWPLTTGIRLLVLFAVASLLFVLTAGGGIADDSGDWPQFLGPQRNGISSEKGLLEVWPDGGPNVVWRAPGGVGMSGLAVHEDHLVTMVQRDEHQWLIELDKRTGAALWQTAIAPEYRNPMGDGPRATPTWFEDQIFVFTGEGFLAAIEARTGKLQWSQPVLRKLSGKPAEYGMACSPLVNGRNVIVTAGAPNATVVAFDRLTGELVWKAGGDPAGYSSPVLLAIANRPQIVTFTGNSVIGLSPETGELLWRHPYETNFDCNIATPIAFQGQVFLSAGENHGSVLLAIESSKSADKKPPFQAKEVWQSQGVQSVLRNEWQTSILLAGHLFGLDNVGGAGPVTHLTCVDASSGKRKWQVPRFGKSNLIAADGKLFFSTMKGELVVAQANPERYEEIGRCKILEMTRQSPALSQGYLYLRDDQEIVCVDVRRR